MPAHAFAALGRVDRYQRDAAEAVPQAPNSVPSLVASYGESAVRYEMGGANFAEDGQYSKASAEATVRSGSGVCTHVNGLLFRRAVAEEAALAAQAQQARARGDWSRTPSRPLPVTLAINAMPQVFVVFGDPREDAHAIGGDAWNALPVVKSWRNTGYRDLPYSVRAQAVAGASGVAGLDEAELHALLAQRPTSLEVDAHLRAHGRPHVGPRLLAEIAASYERGRAVLCDLELTTIAPTLVYEGPDGDEFHPVVDAAAYQRHRLALQSPDFAPWMALRASLGAGDEGGR